MEINFSNIRVHDGSKNNGFEELVCQLAHLKRPKNAKRFVRKEGAGGDAGVECYWVLDDNSEIAWQAKYFMGEMSSSRWSQITKSFKAAIKKHPNIKYYIVCLPIDKADSRKTGRGGKQVKTVEDEWSEQVVKWQKFSAENKRSIRIDYWGKHELTLLLSRNEAQYCGRALYWFNHPILDSEIFNQLTMKTEECLGDRYTADLHVDLPVIRNLDAVCNNEEWHNELKKLVTDLREKTNRFTSGLSDEIDKLATPIKEKVSRIFDLCSVSFPLDEFRKNLQSAQILCNELDEGFDPIWNLYQQRSDDSNSVTKLNNAGKHFFRDLYSISRDVKALLESKKTKSFFSKSALLTGEPGIGKSHLLCEISIQRVNKNLPTVFMLGSHYEGNNPVDLIKDNLDLTGFTNKKVLGALDAAGEACRQRTLIIIDAINEGAHRDIWKTRLHRFITDLKEFEHVSLILSCRSTYLRYILPESLYPDHPEKMVLFEHFGFRRYEHRAVEKYLSQQGISTPSLPILAPEFSNPLFLKTCCKALQSRGLTEFPKGLRGISALFEFYIENVEQVISKTKKYHPRERVVETSLYELASQLFPDHIFGISFSDARALINEKDPNSAVGEPLFDLLLEEGIIAEDVSYKENEKGSAVIRFTYERFSDYFTAKSIIESYNSDQIDFLFKSDEPLSFAIQTYGATAISGIIEIISIIVAEKFKKELVDFERNERILQRWEFDEVFKNSVLWRDSNSFTDRSLRLLNELDQSTDHKPSLDILLRLSTEPNHPWNAEFLHKNLLQLELPERDHFWSIYIATNFNSEEDDEYESPSRVLIEWATSGVISGVNSERIELCGMALAWLLTSPNRMVRDRSTKALVRLYSIFPNLLNKLHDNFKSVDDLYLLERLYAVIYGVVLNIDQHDHVTSLAQTVYENIFEAGFVTPHILLRDYARGVLEYAHSKDLLPPEIDADLFRPPYKSPWPLEHPTDVEIDDLIGDDENYTKSQIKHSIVGGDFGIYTMQCIFKWSATPIHEQQVRTGYEIKKTFAETLDNDLKNLYLSTLRPPSQNTSEIRGFLDDDSEQEQEVLIERVRTDETSDPLKEIVNRIDKSLESEDKEYFRWLNGLNDHSAAQFSRRWAKRWVCKRAYELGWKPELFSAFEKYCKHGRTSGLGAGYMERMGKKYQWIALHECLAYLSDNVHWIDRGFSDIPDDETYKGAWQACRRDIDPTMWLRSCGEYKTYHNFTNTWWQPYSYPFDNVIELGKQKEIMESSEIVPPFKGLLEVKQPNDQTEWWVLNGSWGQSQETKSQHATLSGYFSIQAIVVHEDNFETIIAKLQEGDRSTLRDVFETGTNYQAFLKEYPWHPVYEYSTGWTDTDSRYGIPVDYFTPTTKYDWEGSVKDYSVEEHISIQLPARELVEELGLSHSIKSFAAWELSDRTFFFDPSVSEYGPTYGLVDKTRLKMWLSSKNLRILWAMRGDKTLYSHGERKFYGRLNFQGICYFENNKTEEMITFELQSEQK